MDKTTSEFLLIDHYSSQIGNMLIGVNSRGVCLVEFEDRKALQPEIDDLEKRLDVKTQKGSNELTNQVKTQLDEYFAGSRREFDLPLDTPGTDFQQKVWKGLSSIPYGETSSYKDQSTRLGNVKAIRAVARANGMNRIAIIIPCHRVIGSDGSLTGYAAGVAKKKWLLEHEGLSL